MENIDIINEYLKDVNCFLKVEASTERFEQNISMTKSFSDFIFCCYNIQVRFFGGGGFSFTVYEELNNKSIEELIKIILDNFNYLKDYDDYDNRTIDFANRVNDIYNFLECYEYNTLSKYVKEAKKEINRLKI